MSLGNEFVLCTTRVIVTLFSSSLSTMSCVLRVSLERFSAASGTRDDAAAITPRPFMDTVCCDGVGPSLRSPVLELLRMLELLLCLWLELH